MANERLRSLTLEEAAQLLPIHPQTLRKKALAGEVPGAKLGKRWVFLELDLVALLRARYCSLGRALYERGEVLCSTNAQIAAIGGAASRHLTERKYADRLRLPTEDLPRSLKTG